MSRRLRKRHASFFGGQWRVVSAVDQNQDGKPDLLFQHEDGTLPVWFKEGTEMTSAKLLNPSNLGDTKRVVSAREHRQEDFLDNLCRKLLAYALGRTLMLSDDVLIHDMHAKIAARGYRFSSLLESIVASPQFLNRRTEDDVPRK